jgi:hypothetical protein
MLGWQHGQDTAATTLVRGIFAWRDSRIRAAWPRLRTTRPYWAAPSAGRRRWRNELNGRLGQVSEGGARVAVVMLTLNQRDTTLRALRSLMPQVGERDRVLVLGQRLE